MTLGAFLSSGTAGFVAAKLGRKVCLWMACLLCVVSNVIMMATTDIGALYAGRLLNGLANGYFMTFSQLYIQESSPAKWRGLFLAMFQFCTSFVSQPCTLCLLFSADLQQGTLIGTIIDWATATRPDKSAYLIPLGIIYVVPVFLSIALFFIPESPRWLINRGDYDAGVKSLAWLRPDGASVNIEAEEIRDHIEREQEIGGSVAFLDMFRNPIDRRRTALSICAVLLQAASGSMFIIGEWSLASTGLSVRRLTDRHAAYKAYFFTMAKVGSPFAMSCVLSAVGLVALIINACIVVRFGRRRVLTMNGLIICGFLQLIVAVVYDKKPGQISTGQVLVALSCLYMMSYNVSPTLPQSKCLSLAATDSPTPGPNRVLRMASRRRNPLPTPPKLHLRPRSRRRLLRRLAHDLHGALLHQP
jgi:MFS family permease